MVKKVILNFYRAFFWAIGLCLACMILIALVIQFVVFPNINQYKNEIANYLSTATKQKVAIGEIKVDWKKFDPHLSLSNITLFDAQNRPALQLNDTEILVSWLSIPKLEAHLAELRIVKPELTIRRLKNGEIFVAGISTQGESKPDLANWLLRQSKIKIKDAKVTWLDEMRDAPALSLNELDIELLSPPWKSLIKHHRLSVDATPSVGTKTPITLQAEFYGNDIAELESWHGNANLHLKNAYIPDFKAWVDDPLQISAASGNAHVYLTFAHQKIEAINAQLQLEKLAFQPKPELPRIVLDKLSGEIHWADTILEKSLRLKNVNLAQHSVKLSGVQAEYTENKENKSPSQQFNLTVAELNLGSIEPLIGLLPLNPSQVEELRGLSPTGKLQELNVRWQGIAKQTLSYQLQSKFTGLNLLAYQNIPGFQNISGEIKANDKNGALKLNAENALLDLKEVLRLPLPLEKLNGTINWNIVQKNQQQAIRISTQQLNIANAHLAGFLRGNFLWDNNGGEVDLQGQFGNADLKFAHYYYPKILGESILHWLDSSIISGNGENIRVALKGRLKDFPFVDAKNNLDLKKGLFRISADIKNGVLEYGTGWPLVEDLSLKLLFEGDRMLLKANQGRQLGNQITSATISIPQLDAEDPMLFINANTTGPVSEGILFVNKSPVAEVTQGFTQHLKTGGDGVLDIEIKIPMNRLEDAAFKGRYQISNASLISEDIPELTQMNGLLEFTENSLNANNIRAMSYGAPFTLHVNSGKDKLIRVNAKGKLTPELMQQFLPNSHHYFAGNSDFSTDIVIQKPQFSLNLRSDLVGLTSYLPPPLNKNANDKISLIVEKKQALNGEVFTVNLGQVLAGKISSKIEQNQSRLENITLRLSQGNTALENTQLTDTYALNNAKGAYIYGDLDYLDLDAWRNVYKDLFSANKSANVALPIQKINVKINTLDAFDRRFNQLKLTNKANRDGFIANVDSREISGDLEWQNQQNGKLIGRLNYLSIPDSAPTRINLNPLLPTNINSLANKKLDQIYPAIDLMANQFNFKGKALGGLELTAEPHENSWTIEKFKLVNPESTLSANGVWANVYSGTPSTRFNVDWDFQDLGKTLERLGYPDTLKNGKGDLKGQLNWAGSPHEYDVLALNGNLKFEVKQGQVLKVQPGVGRLLGLVTLQSLPRRLTLDFRDLFSNGFAFDSISGRVSIDKGVMRSDNFSMSGPAADVNITGETNLKTETQKLRVKVFPHITDSLSLAALAGGPLAGAVAFLAQKVLKDPLNKIASTEYEIIGTWDNPQEVKAEKEVENATPNVINRK
jgi:uncharacterized protein (TIGR02099 family)